jgi:hypothetical protein
VSATFSLAWLAVCQIESDQSLERKPRFAHSIFDIAVERPSDVFSNLNPARVAIQLLMCLHIRAGFGS